MPWLAAAQHVVVHARQVMHQRIGIDQLDRVIKLDAAGQGIVPDRIVQAAMTSSADAGACRRRAIKAGVAQPEWALEADWSVNPARRTTPFDDNKPPGAPDASQVKQEMGSAPNQWSLRCGGNGE
jgi:hypothetical protein